ncbi:MAG: glutathione synthase [Candidatus Omnitrophica bacterium]|nr:glutathione synthase [Candidatus Omnitrophota bacterium]
MRLAFLLYPTAAVKVNEDSSFWIMRELSRRGHRVFHFESQDLFAAGGSPHAFLTPSRLDTRKGFLPSEASKTPIDLSRLDCVFIRKEPPFDNGYLYALQLLDLARGKIFILNDPRGIACCNEKIFGLNLQRFSPESLVTENTALAKKFVKNLSTRVVVKPLNNKAGAGIFATFWGDKNLSSLLEIATRGGRKKVLIQRFLTPVGGGDKRILILDGKAIGTFLRKPPRLDFRANLSVGGSMHRASLSKRDRQLVEALAPLLLANGLYFVGIDVIDGYLSEINVTSPSGIPEINALTGVRLERQVADFIESRSG